MRNKEYQNNLNELENKIISDPSTSYWLKDQIKTLQNRDVLDALNDTEILIDILKQKADQLQKT